MGHDVLVRVHLVPTLRVFTIAPGYALLPILIGVIVGTSTDDSGTGEAADPRRDALNSLEDYMRTHDDLDEAIVEDLIYSKYDSVGPSYSDFLILYVKIDRAEDVPQERREKCLGTLERVLDENGLEPGEDEVPLRDVKRLIDDVRGENTEGALRTIDELVEALFDDDRPDTGSRGSTGSTSGFGLGHSMPLLLRVFFVLFLIGLGVILVTSNSFFRGAAQAIIGSALFTLLHYLVSKIYHEVKESTDVI